MATQITCGEGGTTGADWAIRVNELSRLAPKASVRKAVTNTQLILSAEATPLELATDVITQRTGFTASVTDNVPTLVNGNKALESVNISIGLNVSVSSKFDVLALLLYVSTDGVVWTEFSPNPIVIQGPGEDSPVSFFWQSDIEMASGQMLQMWGKSMSGSDFTISMGRSTFKIEADNAELIE